MLSANQYSRCAARIVLCAAFSIGFATPVARAESDLKKVCKIGTILNTLKTDGNAMNFRALGLQAKAQHYQIGCRSEGDDAVMLTTPMDINDELARLTIASLTSNAENANQAAEKLRACVEVWFAQ